MADTLALGASAERHGGSSPLPRTRTERKGFEGTVKGAGRNANSVLPKLFSGRKNLAKSQLILRPQKRGLGKESSACASFCFGELGAGFF